VVLRLSAEGIAGPPHPGKKGGMVGWHRSNPHRNMFNIAAPKQ